MDYKDYQAGATKDFFWFRARDQLLEALLCTLKIETRPKILDVGAGTGDDLSIISRFGDVYAIDINPDAIKLIPDEFIVEKKVCDACNLSYSDNFFDIVIALGVLEHIEDDIKAINEIHRVLKPGGLFIFYVPAFNFLFSYHDRMLNTFRRYTKKSIRKRLSCFRSIELGYWMFILFIPYAIERILKRNKSNTDVQYLKLPKIVNTIFYYIMSVENWLIKKDIRLPIGTIIYGISHK